MQIYNNCIQVFAQLISYLYMDSKQTLRRKTTIYHTGATWQNFSSCGHDPDKLDLQSGSSDQKASICSDYAHDRIYNSREPRERHFGIVLL